MNLEDKNTHLNPKSYKKFYNEVAEKCEVHPDLVDDMVRFFYSKVRKAMESLEYTRVKLPNLGTFITRKGRLDRSIRRHKDMLGNLEKHDFIDYDKHVPLKHKLDKMEKASKRIGEEDNKKKQWKDENR